MVRNILCLFILLSSIVIHPLHAQAVVEGEIQLNSQVPATATVISATKSITFKTGFKASGLNASFNAKIGAFNNISPSTMGIYNTILPVKPTEEQNYVETYSYLTENEGTRSIQYIDGLGRVVQRVDMGMAPDGSDWVTNYSFDSRGLQTGESLPTAQGGNLGAYFQGGQTTSVYNEEQSIYKETILEPSPLKRTIGYKGPGDNLGSHYSSINYNFNNAGEVKRYQVDANGNLVKSTVDYPENSLEKTETNDEDGKMTSQFKDMLGHVVMQQKGADVKTYYVYNDLSQLCYVIPPTAADELQSLNSAIDETNDVMANLCYVYKYDGKGNCIFKKLPGCDPITMVYDSADRLILSQDGEQKLQNQWTVNKYDALGRLVYTGVMTDTFTAAQLEDINGSLVVESYVPKGSTSTFYNTGYTDTFFTGKIKPLVVNYYDNVDFLKYLSQTEQTKFDLPTTSDFSAIMKEMRGVLAGSRIYVLNGLFDKYSTRVNYYNELQLVGYTVASNHVGGYDYTKNDYNFYTGKITKTTQRHSSKFGTVENADINELYTYTYDNGQRLKTTTYKLNDKPAVVLTNNGYDAVGRLTEKKRHSSADTEQFEYNIRSWPTKISSGNFVENIYYNSSDKISQGNECYNGNIAYLDWTYKGNSKGYEFEYNDLNQLKNANYKHSTSTGADGDFDETYVYDKMGNITTLTRKSGGALVDQLTLYYQNQGKSNQLLHIDDAVVENNGQNKNSRKEYFNLHGTTDTEFSYDKNGNIVIDIDRDIVAIRYNLLNLPDLIQFKNGSQIVNTYDATGIKLRTEYFTQVSIVEPVSNGQIVNKSYLIGCVDQNGTIYVDNKEYTTSNGDETLTSLERVYNSEGYVTDLSNPQYYYYRRDHLGDNREVWRANDKTTVQYTQYYPSGLPMASNEGDNPGLQERKYNGKEFVEMHGLDAYDYGARLLFSDRGGSWMSVDPLCEKFYNISPYVYCHNNPINMIDPDGMGDYYTKDGIRLGSDGINDNLAYTSSGKTTVDVKDEDGNVIGQKTIFNDSQKLSVTNDVLNIYANTVAAESSGNKTESFAIASTILNISKYKDKGILKTIQTEGIYGYKDGGNSTNYKNNSKYGMAAAINALTGGTDYSGGALRWDGFDLAAKGFNHIKARTAGIEISDKNFNSFKAAWPDKLIKAFSGGTYTGFSNDFNSGLHPATQGNNKGLVLYQATIVLGRTIFWGPKSNRKGL